MNTKNNTKPRVFGWILLPFLAFAGQAAGCIVVEDTCVEYELTCHGDYVDECIDDTWVTVDDCFSACGGTCGYLNDGEVVCVCPL